MACNRMPQLVQNGRWKCLHLRQGVLVLDAKTGGARRKVGRTLGQQRLVAGQFGALILLIDGRLPVCKSAHSLAITKGCSADFGVVLLFPKSRLHSRFLWW